MKVPVTIANQGATAARVTLTETANDTSMRVVLPTAAINVAANAAVTTFVTITSLSEKYGAQINLVASGAVGTGATVITYTAS